MANDGCLRHLEPSFAIWRRETPTEAFTTTGARIPGVAPVDRLARVTIRVGISGWTYRPWRGDFYPTGLRQRDELSFVAERMNSVEINGSFYSCLLYTSPSPRDKS